MSPSSFLFSILLSLIQQTLQLKEIETMAGSISTKILQSFQTQEYPIEAVELSELIEQHFGDFRSDLYWRILTPTSSQIPKDVASVGPAFSFVLKSEAEKEKFKKEVCPKISKCVLGKGSLRPAAFIDLHPASN